MSTSRSSRRGFVKQVVFAGSGLGAAAILQHHADGTVQVRNLVEAAKRPVPAMIATLEPDLLYPLLCSRDVRRWQATPSAWLLLAQDPQHRRGLDEDRLQSTYPRTYAYLKQFEPVLRARAAFRRYYTRRQATGVVETGPFYSMFGVGPYSLAPYKVVWHRMRAPIGAAVVGPLDTRPVVPQETHAFVAVEARDEAFYVAGLINSTWFNVAARACSQAGAKSFGSPHLLEHLRIPRFDPADPVHRHLSDLAERVHKNVSRQPTGEWAALVAQLDASAARVWRLDPAAWREVQVGRSACEAEFGKMSGAV